MMNQAHWRTWLKLAASVAGILVMSGALVAIEIFDLRLTNPKDHKAFYLLGILNTIPLICFAVIDWGWKKVYDERDKHIARQSDIIGGIAAVVFLGGAAFCALILMSPLGSISFYSLTGWVVLVLYVGWSASSIAALVQYHRGGGDE
jgi:hypothetical protein